MGRWLNSSDVICVLIVSNPSYLRPAYFPLKQQWGTPTNTGKCHQAINWPKWWEKPSPPQCWETTACLLFPGHSSSLIISGAHLLPVAAQTPLSQHLLGQHEHFLGLSILITILILKNFILVWYPAVCIGQRGVCRVWGWAAKAWQCKEKHCFPSELHHSG